MPNVSIVIPVYNCEKTLERALNSVLSQTYQDFEVVIVDNNSTDNSMSIVEKFREKMNIKIVTCSLQGIVPALNTGLRNCEGKWIARQDGEDYWYPEKLQKQIDFLEANPTVKIVGTQIRLLDEEGNVEEMGTFGKEVRYQTENQMMKIGFLYGQNQICHPSVVFSKDVIDLCGGYEQLYPLAEDLHFWFKAFPHFNFANINEVLIDYTQTKSGNYDARVPMLMADTYYELFKKAGVVEGEREDLIMEWQTVPGGHKHGAV